MPSRPCRHRTCVSSWMDASCGKPPLAERTVLELSRRIQRWQQHPSGPEHAPKPVRQSALRARDRLVTHNLRLVPHIWRRHRHSLPANDEATADAFQEAALHLMRAAEKFDPTKGYSFSTYATHWVRCGFGEVERRGKRTIRFPYDKAKLVLRAMRLVEQHRCATGEPLSIAALTEQLQGSGRPITEVQVLELLQQWALTYTESLDSPSPGDHAGHGSGDGAADRSWRMEQASLRRAAEHQAEANDPAALLPQLMEQLEPLEQRMIRNRYLRRPPLTPHQLRRSMGLEPDQMQALEQQAMAKLRKAAAQALRALD